MLNRATALLNFADADAQFQRRYCSISPAEALNFNAVCTCVGIILFYRVRDCEPFVCVTQGEIATSTIVFANYDINPYFIMAFPYASQI